MIHSLFLPDFALRHVLVRLPVLEAWSSQLAFRHPLWAMPAPVADHDAATAGKRLSRNSSVSAVADYGHAANDDTSFETVARHDDD